MNPDNRRLLLRSRNTGKEITGGKYFLYCTKPYWPVLSLVRPAVWASLCATRDF